MAGEARQGFWYRAESTRRGEARPGQARRGKARQGKVLFSTLQGTTMLVLTRRLHESVDIGDDIRITIVRLNAIEVRIGIEAPDHVHIKRSELLDDKDNPWPGIRSSE